jgi:hypothetical protein
MVLTKNRGWGLGVGFWFLVSGFWFLTHRAILVFGRRSFVSGWVRWISLGLAGRNCVENSGCVRNRRFGIAELELGMGMTLTSGSG